MKLKKITLKNGLEIFLFNDKTVHTTNIDFITLFGGLTTKFIYKNKNYSIPNGVAHLLEHYIYECGKGGDLNDLGEKYVYTNALTNPRGTNVYASGAINIEYALKKILENVYYPNFNKKSLEKIKKPIYEEIRSVDDSNYAEFDSYYLKSLFPNIGYESTIGKIKDIENITIDILKLCHKAFYHPKNQYLFIYGNFNERNILKIINDFFKEVTFEDYGTKKMLDLTSIKKPSTYKLKANVQEYSVRFTIKINTKENKELLKLEKIYYRFLYSSFESLSSNTEYLKKQGLITTNISYSIQYLEGYFILELNADTLKPKKLIKYFKDFFKDITFDLQDYNLKEKIAKTHFVLRYDSLKSVVRPFINNYLDYNYQSLETIEDCHIPFEEYKKVISNTDFSTYSVGILSPKK